MKKQLRFWSVVAGATVVAGTVIAAPPPGGAGPSSKTVTVDCTSPSAKIANALKDKSDELTVVISGVCSENVEIRRNEVTLRGASGDPTVDGIHGVVATPQPLAVVGVWNAENVTIQDLGIANGAQVGLGSWSAINLQVINCRLENNAGSGGHFSIDSNVYAERVAFLNNGTNGLRAQRVTRFSGAGCTFSGNNGPAISVGESATASLYSFEPTVGAPVPTSITGGRGVSVTGASSCYLEEGSVTVTGTSLPGGGTTYRQGLAASDGGRIDAYLTSVTGPVYAVAKGMTVLYQVSQTTTPSGQNSVDGDGLLELQDSTITMPTQVSGFGKLLMYAGTLTASLTCSAAGDAYHSGGTISGAVTGCASWTP